MREDLLGYLLGALEPHEMRRVERLIQENPVAREELAELERALKPLDDSVDAASDLIPSDLVSKTMANLPPLPAKETVADRFQDASFESLIPMSTDFELSESKSWSWLDWIGGATAAAVILGLLLPSIAEGRFEARKVACQMHLRELGTAITQFVNRDSQHRLPAVAESGPEAFAGIYAVRLRDAGLLPDASLRWCPSMATPKASAVTLTPINTVESIEDLHHASADGLRQIQQIAGGHYAYALGGVDHQDRLKAPRFQCRASFPVMSDAPPAGFNHLDDLRRLVGHGGQGINVLFEDGRVQFIALPMLNSMPDHPLLNNRGKAEAGVTIDDASLAPSWGAPFINAVQH